MDNLQKLESRTQEVFEDKEVAVQWLESPNPILNNKKPIDLATTDAGLNEVLQLLGRLEHGIFS